MTTSSAAEPPAGGAMTAIVKPDCPHCGGLGYACPVGAG